MWFCMPLEKYNPGTKQKIIKSQSGQASYMAIAAVAIISIMSVNMISSKTQVNQMLNTAKLDLVVDQIQRRLVSIVMTPAAWQRIQSGNTSAFNQAGGVYPNPPLLDIYQADGTTAPYYRTTQANAGFDTSGNPCNEFSLEGNDACPIRFEVSLLSRNQINGTWVDTLRFRLKYRAHSSAQIFNENKSQFNYDFVRNYNSQSVESVCISVGGNYSSSSNSCTVSFAHDVQCGTGSALAGNYNNPCQPINLTYQCLGNQAVRGLSSNGTPICQNI